MSAPVPYVGLAQDPSAPVVVQAPPDTDQLVQQIVAILLLGYAVKKTAAMLAAVLPGIPMEIWAASISVTGGMAAQRHPRLDFFELAPDSEGAKVARSATRKEIFYRAAYVLNAARRIQENVRAGEKLQDAARAERQHAERHSQARAARVAAIVRVAVAADRFGNLLGWYLDPLLNNERECIAANGHNFYADQGTVIGYPGSVHPNCGCRPGPPHEGAELVNTVVARDGAIIFSQPRRYRLRQKAS